MKAAVAAGATALACRPRSHNEPGRTSAPKPVAILIRGFAPVAPRSLFLGGNIERVARFS
jgi:hypothetical protein